MELDDIFWYSKLMLGDLLLDFLDQKKVIKNSAKEFARLYDFFEIYPQVFALITQGQILKIT